MIKLSTDNLKPNMVLSRSIFDPTGQFLLKAGTVLTSRHITYLQKKLISTVYIVTDSAAFKNVSQPLNLIQEQTRQFALKVTFNAFKKYKLNQNIDSRAIEQVVSAILNDLLQDEDILLHTADIRASDAYTFAHSVNVCVLSSMLALTCGYDTERVREIATGAILHDIGKILIPESIINKPGPLTASEWRIVQEHSLLGFDMLNTEDKFSDAVQCITAQHHEHYDGSGYPFNLSGNKIHEYARIVSIADVYDALTSDRAYKRACSPNVAHNIMIKDTSDCFDKDLLYTFFDNVALYPIGTVVLLRTGLYAIITGVERRPRINVPVSILRIIANNDMSYIRKPSTIRIDGNYDEIIDRLAQPDEVEVLLRIIT